MHIEPFMLGSSLILAQAQRLFRRLCKACKRPVALDPKILEANQIDPVFFEGATVYAAKGCPRCGGGFKGRGSIMEVMLVTDSIREAILRNATATELMKLGRENGMRTLKESGLYRVKEGVTSLEAALEVTGGG
jgi:type IV pilus assembly protein PilB